MVVRDEPGPCGFLIYSKVHPAVGTSFNGRTPRSGRGYWGSNPYVPARLRSRLRRELRPGRPRRGRRTIQASSPPERSLSRRSPCSGRRRTISAYVSIVDLCGLRVLRGHYPREPPDFLTIFAGARNATASVMEGIGRRFVYILRSERDPARHYVGRTADVPERLRWHNEGPSGQTVRHRPWRALVSLEFPDGGTAARFERYLKSGSGRAFAKRHFGGV